MKPSRSGTLQYEGESERERESESDQFNTKHLGLLALPPGTHSLLTEAVFKLERANRRVTGNEMILCFVVRKAHTPLLKITHWSEVNTK